MDTFVESEKAKLPQEVSLVSLIQSRYSELNQIIREFKTSSPKLASQKLPIHMRRRAASHNVNRLPSKTRTIVSKKNKVIDTISEGKEKKRKKLRKYRNQLKVNLSHAVREMKPDRSLLHVWFVKRFKMVKMFGQLVPDHNNTKNLRKIQEMSKSGCAHFHLSHFKSIIIRYQNIDSLSQMLKKISRDCLKTFLEKQSEGIATWTIFYSHSDAESTIIGPGYLVLNTELKVLIIWCHSLIQSEVLRHLLSFCDSLTSVIDGDKIYELFSLIGPESLSRLKKVMGDSGSFLPDKLEEGHSYTIGASSLATSQQLDTSEECFIITTMKTDNRMLVFITAPRIKSRDFWYQLIKNRTHLVGGSRDLKILASEMRCLHFPSVGYPDLLDASNSYQSTWALIMRINAESAHYFVLRDQTLLNSLKCDLTNLVSVDRLLASSPNLRNCLIIVEIICINRGTLEQGDIICLPTADDTAKFMGRKKIDMKLNPIGHGPIEPRKVSGYGSLELSSRKVIGLVEFGHFSLDLGASKGFGAIAFLSLSDLVKLADGKLIALVRSFQSNTFRFVEVIVDSLQTI